MIPVVVIADSKLKRCALVYGTRVLDFDQTKRLVRILYIVLDLHVRRTEPKGSL